MLHPYCFSSNGISVKSSRDVRCTLLSLLPLFVYFFVLPSLLYPSIFVTVLFFCCPLGSTLAYILLCFFSAIIFRMTYQSSLIRCMCVYCHTLYNRCSSMHHTLPRDHHIASHHHWGASMIHMVKYVQCMNA